jgi:hypothetical protein
MIRAARPGNAPQARTRRADAADGALAPLVDCEAKVSQLQGAVGGEENVLGPGESHRRELACE